MEESDRTLALKKAYVEIILNTAKEAAARVMVSERKALRFQQDLSSSKDEALRLLVRLKQMIDAKTIEAEITSSNQQKRIDELEAQLQEAEDIITDLRSDLQWMRDKLAKAKRNQLQPLNVKNTAEEAFPLQEANHYPISNFAPNGGIINGAVSDTRDTQLKQSPLHNDCGNEVVLSERLNGSNSEGCYPHESNLDSIMSNKEPERRNGRPQKICTLEGKVLGGKLSPSGGIVDQCTPGQSDEEGLMSAKVDDNETSVKEKKRHIVLALKAKNDEMTKKPSREGMIKTIRGHALRRRRKTGYGKAKAALRKTHLGQLLKPCQSISVPSHCKTPILKGNDDGLHTQPSENAEKADVVKNSKGLEEHLQQKSSFYGDEIAIIRRGKRNRNMKSLASITSLSKPPDQQDSPPQQSSVPPSSMNWSNLVSVKVKSGEEKLMVTDNESKIKPLPRLDPGLTLIRSNVDPISGSKNVTVSMKSSCRLKPAAEKNEQLKAALEDTVVSSSEMKPEMVNIPLVYSDMKQTGASKDIIGSPSKADSNRLVKYTFQRKRKKGSLSDTDENISPVKRKVDEKQNGTRETQEPKPVNEPSRGTRRLVQVARQLISLSGKRW